MTNKAIKAITGNFNTLAFRNGFEYHNSDLHVLKGTIFATFYTILVKIGSLTQEITQVQEFSVPFGTDGKNRRIIPNISASTGPNFTNFQHCRLMYADYKTEIILR